MSATLIKLDEGFQYIDTIRDEVFTYTSSDVVIPFNFSHYFFCFSCCFRFSCCILLCSAPTLISCFFRNCSTYTTVLILLSKYFCSPTLNRIRENVNIKIGDSLFIEPFLVPHRDEYSETVGYQVTGQNNSLLYIPDIDIWNKWEQDIFKIILNIDIALLDGTFYSQNELPNRDMKEIPHPFISESMELFFDLSTTNRKKIYFIHLNHSNPTLKLNSPEWINVYEEGFNISKEGDIFRL